MIEVIAAARSDIWEIDANHYSDEDMEAVLEVASQIGVAFPEASSDILVTKIMLGVFGCVPAFDTNFKSGFGGTFGKGSLQRVASFYEENAPVYRSAPRLDP